MQREKAASDFDQLKSSGAPEYVVSIREVKAEGSRTAVAVAAASHDHNLACTRQPR